ncbi:site-2 protease family protein [Kitasatospora viridis]|uniref:Zinc metalloprotease n=1 Tax=Kitasatospora viridis TaxID=281105 RepID=A0A561TV63_9ACTN|nr:site-2 protease family protein [Kitasatospora viridis]TWF91006.1 Zn-dependent protease [Kitasatospora viridis]
MRGSAPLGKVFGVPLKVHWSAPVLVLFLGVGLARQVLPVWAPGRSGTVYDLAGLVGALLLTLGLLAHEAAHAVAARRAGIPVEDMTVFALGGVTRMGRPPTPRLQFATAGVGPLTSLVLGGLSLAAGLGVQHGLHWTLPAAVLLWNGWTNLLLAGFNLLPAAPLDGGRLLQAGLWWRGGDRERAERIAGRAGQAGGVALTAVGWILFLRGDSAGFWLVLAGLFIWTSALAEVRRATLITRLGGLRIGQVMTSPVATVPDWTTVERLLAEAAEHPDRPVPAVFPLVDFDGRPSGLADLRRLALLPQARRAEVRVRELARPLARCAVAGPDDELVQVLEHATAPPPVLVVVDGRLVGLVTGAEIVRLLRGGARPVS